MRTCNKGQVVGCAWSCSAHDALHLTSIRLEMIMFVEFLADMHFLCVLECIGFFYTAYFSCILNSLEVM